MKAYAFWEMRPEMTKKFAVNLVKYMSIAKILAMVQRSLKENPVRTFKPFFYIAYKKEDI